MKQLIALVCLTLGLTTPGHAEDPAAVVAALNDPAAECRYLRQKWSEAKTANENFTAVTKEFTSAVGAVQNANMFNRAAAMERAEKLQHQTTAYRAVASRTLVEYNGAKQVVKAKRGVQEPCPGVEKDDYQEVPQHTEAKPQGSLEARLQELKDQRERKEITAEQYYEQRVEVLKGL